MTGINGQFMLTMLVIASGYIAKRLGILKQKDGETLSRIIFNFTLPSVIMKTFSDVTIEASLILLLLTCTAFGLLVTLLAWILFRKEDRRMRGVLTMCAGGFNIGIFAFPLVEAIWKEEGLKYFGMLDMGNAWIVFGTSYLAASYFSPEAKEINIKEMVGRMLRSIPLLVYTVTLAVNLTGLRFPRTILGIADILARANMPLSLLLLGISLSFTFERHCWISILKVVAVRYLAGIAAGTALYFLLPFGLMFKQTVLIGLILPVAMAPLVYANRFGYDDKLTGTIINFSIMISFVLIWATAAFVI